LSSDNTIAILITSGPEYRVAHIQAMERLRNDDRSMNEEVVKNLFSKSNILHQEIDVFREAQEIYDGIMEDKFCPIVEYGITIHNFEKQNFPN